MSPITTEVVPLESAPPEKPSDRRPLLLIVDDEVLVADTLRAILTREGFNVVTAYNGTSALQLGAERVPDLMITDVAMPGMNGVELAQAMKSICPECKVLLFSGSNASGRVVASCGEQFRLLTKPLHPTTLVQYIARELGLPDPAPRIIPRTFSIAQAELA